MGTERSRQLLLAGLVVVLIVAIVRLWSDTSTVPPPSSNPADAAARPAQNTGKGGNVPPPPEVHLDALNAEHPKPETAERNLFRFKPKEAPPSPPPSSAAKPVEPAPPAVSAGPPPPPPVPPITLKFIGIVEAPSHGEKIAILSDGRNAPFYGKEGAIIEGRYRILKIGVESVELAYADGRGRQTIRLTGS